MGKDKDSKGSRTATDRLGKSDYAEALEPLARESFTRLLKPIPST